MLSNSFVPLVELSSKLEDRKGAFLCCASFEDRCKSIPRAVRTVPFSITRIFATDDCSNLISDAAVEIRQATESRASIVSVKMKDPLYTANEISKVIKELKEAKVSDITIDISTFTHELLLIVLKLILGSKDLFSRITLLYVGAQDYSLNEPLEKKWLSKGCREVRSVVGYPGLLIPGRPTDLIVLVGFEHERAKRLIVELDPEYLTLAKGISSNEHLTHDSHQAPMDYFHSLLKEMMSSRGNVEHFEFSPRDIDKTIELLLKQIQKSPEYNHIIVPLNTKLSTVSVALVAYQNPNVQVCYAEPETYNFSGYSLADDRVLIYEVPL